MKRLALTITTSTDVASAGELPREERLFVIPPLTSRLQKLSASVISAVYFGVNSALEDNLPSGSAQRIENATSGLLEIYESSRQVILDALSSQPVDELQDGMTAQLGMRLARSLRDFGGSGLAELTVVVLRGEAHPEALSHAMRWVGRLVDPESFHARLLALVRSLEAPSATVRDGAALGLVELGSPDALPAVTAAIGREPNPALRRDLERVAAYLRSIA